MHLSGFSVRNLYQVNSIVPDDEGKIPCYRRIPANRCEQNDRGKHHFETTNEITDLCEN